MRSVCCTTSSGCRRNASDKERVQRGGRDIDLEATAIKALIRNLTFRRKGHHTMLGNVGHFAGLIDSGTQALALTT